MIDNRKIIDLNMSSRTTNVLMDNNIDTVEDLKALNLSKIYKLRNLGIMSRKELLAKIKEENIKLQPDNEIY